MAEETKTGGEERLGDLLVRKSMITAEQLDQAVQCQVLFGGRLGTNLLELGFVREETLRGLLEEKYGMGSVSRVDLLDVPVEVINLISRKVAVEHKLAPLRLQGDELEVAMLDPGREDSVRVLAALTSLRIRPLIALELDLYWALEKYYAEKREARYINLDRWLDHQRARQAEPKRKREKKAPPSQVEPLLPNPRDITSAEGAPRTLEDFWDRVGRTGHPEYLLPRVLEDLKTASDRNEIGSIILDFAALNFFRTILFVVNEDMLFGWDGRGEGIDSRSALSIMLPLSRRSVFKTVLETGAYFLGPLPDSTINRRFLGALGPARPKTVLVLPIFVAGKVAAILYGDMGHGQELSSVPSTMPTVLASASQAFQRLIVHQKSTNLRLPEKD